MIRLILAWAVCFLIAVNGAFAPKVTYVSFISPSIFRPFSADKAGSSVLNVSQADDTPIDSVHLPQVIQYYGQYIDRLYVSPNGFVQVSPVPTCGYAFCGTCQTNFTPYDKGIIAGFIQDFNPYEDDSAVISVKYSEHETVVVYDSLPLFNTNVNDTKRWSFRVALHVGGAAKISYDNISTLSTNEKNKKDGFCFISGLMASVQNGNAVVTDEQRRVGREVWGSAIDGVYPPSQVEVATGNSFDVCPISTTWCGTPSRLNTTLSATSPPLLFNASALSMACQLKDASTWGVYVEIALLLSDSAAITVDSVSATDPFVALCVEYSTASDAPVVFGCDVSHLAYNLSLMTSSYFHVAWRSRQQGSTPSAADVFTVLDGVLPIPVSAKQPGDGSECALNEAVNTCSSCDICRGYNLTQCMALNCTADEAEVSAISPYPNDIVEPLDGLFTALSCNASCEHVYDYALDVYSKCCKIEDIDCLGICNGENPGGVSKDTGNSVCCTGDLPIDCNGVCGGGAVYDTCNVCGGNDTGVKCSTNVTIVVDSIDPHAFYTFYNGSSSIVISTLTLFNLGDSSLQVAFSISDSDQKKDPFVWIPIGEYQIAATTSQTFSISSSISRLYQGTNVTSWDVKTVTVK